MTKREGSLEAPTRHPLDWKIAGILRRARAAQGTRAGLRHLPWLPPLRQPVRCVPDAVRPGRRRRDRRTRRRAEGALLEGRRPVLPVRHVLHDQVPVRAAASVERRLPAPDAAREGGRVQAARRERPRPVPDLHRPLGKLRRHSRRRRSSSTRRTAPRRRAPAMEKVLGVDRNAGVPTSRPAVSRRRALELAGRRCSDGAQDAGQGRDLLDLLRQLQRAWHRPRPARASSSTTRFHTCSSRRRPAAACRSSSSAIWSRSSG